VGQFAGQVFTEQTVGEEQAADDRQRNAHYPPRGFEDQCNQHHANEHVGRRQVAGTLDQIRFEHPLIQRGAHACQAEEPGQWLPGAALAVSRVAEKDHPQQEADVHRAQHLTGDRGKGCGDDLEYRKQQRYVKQRFWPVPRVRGNAVMLIAHWRPAS